MPYIVALTGGIGSGKTTVASAFARHGVAVVDADIIARKVVQMNTPALAKIVKRFGHAILMTSGELNRTALREIIFSQPDSKI